MTNKDAKAIIEENKSNTAFYGENNTHCITGENITTYDSLYDMFRGRFGMGKAETLCIIASLKLSGAKIAGERTLDY